MTDANQIWGVDEAIEYMKRLSEFGPYWIEEPTPRVMMSSVINVLRMASGPLELGLLLESRSPPLLFSSSY